MGVETPERKQKVCLVTISLAGGGAERSTAVLSQMLNSKGYHVTTAVVVNAVDYEYSGSLYAIGSGKKSFGFISSFMRLRRFRSFLKREQFDLIIDNRSRPENFKERIYSGYLYKGFKLLYVVRSFRLATYFPASKPLAQKMIDRALGVVGVSKAIAKAVKEQYNTEKVYQVYNPVPLASIQAQAGTKMMAGDYIMAMGRLYDDVKNYSLLLEAYAASKLPANKIQLFLMGDGPDKVKLQDKAHVLELDKMVQFLPFNPNPYPFLQGAKCSVLTSHYDGFPRAVIESLAVGTPVVSVDCQSGPAEIIQPGENGLLVPNYNVAALAEALNNIIFDQELLAKCRQNAKTSVAHLDVDVIADHWDKLIQELL